jgi:hypothetical protein
MGSVLLPVHNSTRYSGHVDPVRPLMWFPSFSQLFLVYVLLLSSVVSCHTTAVPASDKPAAAATASEGDSCKSVVLAILKHLWCIGSLLEARNVQNPRAGAFCSVVQSLTTQLP